ncbi:MAG TPA: GTPase HflX [Thermodesulfobacteriota bacterium]|nr:GTPase HflX [Thermodesulfobacteriota bacterium]
MIAIQKIFGNTLGLKPSQARRILSLYRRRVHPERVITPELARTLTEISKDVNRQLAVLIDRGGNVRYVVVGGPFGIWIPELADFRLGAGPRLRGLRFVHTHLKGEALSHDDLTDLALLRFDLMAAIEVLDSGLPGNIFLANLIPLNDKGENWRKWEPQPLSNLEVNALDVIHALEQEFGRTQRGREARDRRDRAVLVHASSAPKWAIEDSLNELADLADSAGVVVLDRISQRRHQFHPRFLMGREKLTDLSIRAFQRGADLLIFDQELNPNQMRSIAELTELRVIDRSQLILDIFAQRAHTREGKLKVELAQLKYLLPRLTTKDSGLSRLTGGIGGRGPGETKLEVDRRKVRDRIHRLSQELRNLDRGRDVRRKQRQENRVPVISIVGYTNVGKSTLLNALTKSEVYVENKLFATLDPTSRRLRMPREREVVITDTVGFLRDLPKDLVDAFRATLEELQDADVLLHVVDVSHPRFEEQMGAVEKILEELGLNGIPIIRVFNKADRVDAETAEGLARAHDGLLISAVRPETFGPLLEAIEEKLPERADFIERRRYRDTPADPGAQHPA